MKARDTDRTTTRRIVMLKAADLVERERRYNYYALDVPGSCDDAGCVLGWIGFCAGFHGGGKMEPIAKWLGYPSAVDFYDAMTNAGGVFDCAWYDDCRAAATALRKLANEAPDNG